MTRLSYFIIAVAVLLLVRSIAIPAFTHQPSYASSTPLMIEDAVYENSFTMLDLGAKAAFVYDIHEDRVLYSTNAKATLPLASITKVMTALVATENILPETVITVPPTSLAYSGDHGIAPWEDFQVSELIKLMLVSSSNDSAHALAAAASPADEGAGITALMNARAQELGLTNTYFLNETGLDVLDGISAGAYGSAQDVAMLMTYVTTTHPQLLEPTRHSTITIASEDGVLHTVTNTNSLVHDIPRLLGSKTGFTDFAGGNLAVVFDAEVDRPVVAVVLGSTKSGRFSDIRQLVGKTREAIQP